MSGRARWKRPRPQGPDLFTPAEGSPDLEPGESARAGGVGGAAPDGERGNTPPAIPTPSPDGLVPQRSASAAGGTGEGSLRRGWWSRAGGCWTVTEADRVELQTPALLDDDATEGLVFAELEAAAVLAEHGPASSSRSRRAAMLATVEAQAAGAFQPHGCHPAPGDGLDYETACDARRLKIMTEWRAGERHDRAAAERGQATAEALQAEHARRAERIRAGGVRVVGHGVDTIHVSIWTPIASGIRARLTALRAVAERSEGRVVIGRGAHRWILAPHGAAGGYRWRLDGPWCSISLRAQDVSGQASWFVEVRSAWLWRAGVDAVIGELQALARAWAPTEWRGDVRVTVARLDLAVDYQGWVPSGRELIATPCEHCGRRPAVAFVTRAMWRAVYMEAERAAWGADLGEAEAAERAEAFKRAERAGQACDRDTRGDAVWLRGQALSGFSFGRGEVAARMYDKTREIRTGGKLWFHAVWRAGGADPEAPVWRLEFQLRGEALRRGVLAVVEPGRPVGVASGADWPVVRRALDGIWAAMTGRDGPGWLSARDPSTGNEGREGKNKARWGVRREWEALAAVRFGRAAEWARTYPVRKPTVAQTWAAEDAAAVGARTSAALPEMRPDGPTWDPDVRGLIRGAGRPETVAICATLRTTEDVDQRRAARTIGVMMAAETADRLQAQALGTLLTYAAARAAERGEDPPQSDEAARALVLREARALLSAGGGEGAPATRCAGELRLRAARLPTAQAVRADLGTAVGIWHDARA